MGIFRFYQFRRDRYVVTSPAPTMNENMAAAVELRCWGGDWGLPSVHTESLIVLVTFIVVYKLTTIMSSHSFKTTCFIL